MGKHIKDMMEFRKRKLLFKAILASTPTNKNKNIPSEEQYIYFELINGIIHYVGGEAGKISPKKFSHRNFGFEYDLEKDLKEELKLHKKLPNKLEKDLLRMVHPYQLDHGFQASDATTECEVYQFLGNFIGSEILLYPDKSINLLQEKVIDEAKKTIESYDELTRESVIGIGKSMRKYIELDIPEIKRTHFW